MKHLAFICVFATVAAMAFGARYDIDFQAISDARDAHVFDGPDMLKATNLPLRIENKTGKPYRKEVSWRVKLPHDRGGDCAWAFAYKMHHDKPFLGSGYAEVIDADTKAMVWQTTLVENAWRDPFIARLVTASVGCKEVIIRFALLGTGWLEVSRARFEMLPDAPEETPVEIHCSPAHWLDGKYYISSGQSGSMRWRWQTHPMRRYPQEELSFDLVVPRGFELSEAAFCDMARATHKRLADGSVAWRLPVEKKPASAFDCNFRGPFHENRYGSITHDLQIVSTGEAGTEGDLRLTMFLKGKPLSNTETVRLVTIPTIRTELPKRWQSGIFLNPEVGRFRTARGVRDYTDLARACGVDCVIHMVKHGTKWEPRLRDAWRASGVRTIMPFWMSLADGYRIGPHEGRPAEDKFVSAWDLGAKGARHDGRTMQDHPIGACPTAVYEERPFFVTNTLPALAAQLKGEDGIWTNWEPWGYKNEGCFCTNCLKKFAGWMGKTVEEVAAVWPNCARDGGKWRKEAIAFRVAEHAKMVRVLNRHIAEMTGGEKSYGLVQGISFTEMTYAARDIDIVLPEFSPLGYAADVKWINPWGPYPHYRMYNSYVYYKRDVLRTFYTAKDIRETVDRDYPAGHRPKLLAAPQGIQGLGWITAPGWFEMSLDAFFFNGWHAAAPFLFPGENDARWWQAYADATRRAAKYEDFVYDGRRVDGEVALASVPEYAHPNVGYIPRLPKYVDTPMLHAVAYDHDGVRIVAVFNYWDWAEAFFKLKATGLAAGEWTVVDEWGKRYQPTADRATWTAEELAKGVDLVVPKATTRVFELRPASRPGTVKASVTAADIAAGYAKRRPELKKLADADAEYERVNASSDEAGAGEASDAAL